MKALRMTAFAISFFTFFNSYAQDEQAIWKAMEKTLETFYAYDATGFASNFSDDCVLINPLGMAFQGPETIESVHEEVFRAWGKPSEDLWHKQSNKVFRNICEDVVQLSFTHEVKGDPKAGEGQMTLMMLFVKQDNQWKIKSGQLTPVVEMPKGN